MSNVERFNGILSSKILSWDGLLGILSLGKAINFYNFMIVERVRLFGSGPYLNCSLNEWVCAKRKNKLKTEGVAGLKGTVIQSLQTDFICSNHV